MSAKPKSNESYVKGHYGFSYIFSPEEERFIKHMQEADQLKRRGYKADFTRAEYARRMGLREYTLDKCAESLCRLGLVVKTADSCRNRVYYRLDRSVYDRLVGIVSMTRNVDKLIQFFDFHVRQLGKSVGELTDDDIEGLVS
jgi:hypothetical protein